MGVSPTLSRLAKASYQSLGFCFPDLPPHTPLLAVRFLKWESCIASASYPAPQKRNWRRRSRPLLTAHLPVSRYTIPSSPGNTRAKSKKTQPDAPDEQETHITLKNWRMCSRLPMAAHLQFSKLNIPHLIEKIKQKSGKAKQVWPTNLPSNQHHKKRREGMPRKKR